MMKKNPFLLALLILAVIFLFFFAIALLIVHFSGREFAFGDKVGVVEVTGVITSSRETIDHLLLFRKDDSIKAIVLRIDSPGGGVGPSQEIHEEVRKTAAQKPVVISMGSVAASGGYYIAAPAQRILANPGTITGSIGVIMEFANIQDLLEKIGLQMNVVKSGDHKDIASPVRDMSEGDRAILQEVIDDVHQQFVTAICEGRQLEMEKVQSLADGRIFTGRQAMQAGLVDELGNLQDAIAVAAQMGNISGEPNVVYPPREKMKIIDYLVQETVSGLRHGLREGPVGLQFLWSGVE
ncbi:MAG: signal peptide peptidase SppA [Desulfuromonadales bacterium]|jgi:protease-4